MSVEGIPNGWRQVRVGRVCHGETRIDSNGNPLKWTDIKPSQSKNLVIIEMIKDTKQYREPDLSDLANGPIEIEACTPDPDTGERRWRRRKLVAIQTESRKPFVVEHPNHRGMVVCYKEARIEVGASSEAGSPSDLALVNTQVIDAFIGQWPREIPPGFMLLHLDSKTEPREIGDCFWCVSRGRWEMIPDVILDQANRQSWAAIRRIPEKPLAIPEGWRELNESDFIEQSDKYDDGNRWMPYTYDPANPKSVRFNKGIHVRHIRKIECDHHVCELAKPTGVTCPPDSCDLDNGIREFPAKQPETTARCDSEGRDVTEMPGLWTEGDTQYREPTQADLVNGPIEVEVCDAQTGDDHWEIRTLFAICPPSIWSRYVTAFPDCTESTQTWRFARIKIEEPAPQIAQVPDVQVTIYREPTQADLANGPIRCRVRDSKDHRWIDRVLYAIMPETVYGRFVTISVDQRHVGSWIYCEIIEHPKTIVIGDLVRLTARPKGVGREGWVHAMNNHVGKITKVSGITDDGRLLLNGCGGWRFHPDWLEVVDDKASESEKGGEA